MQLNRWGEKYELSGALIACSFSDPQMTQMAQILKYDPSKGSCLSRILGDPLLW